MFSTTTLALDYQQQQLAELRVFLKWLLPVAFSMATLQVITGIITTSRVIGISAVPTYCFGLLMFLALWYLSRGRLFSAVMTICVGFFAVAIALFILVPAW